jgi:hypothetical protein
LQKAYVMVDGITSISANAGNAKPPVTPPSVNSSTSSQSAAFTQPKLPASFENPRVVQDPTAGYITEYLGSNGQIISQTPSAITVAYLRNGLLPDGTPKHPGQEAPTAVATSV